MKVPFEYLHISSIRYKHLRSFNILRALYISLVLKWNFLLDSIKVYWFYSLKEAQTPTLFLF